jgi:hypothetical protein
VKIIKIPLRIGVDFGAVPSLSSNYLESGWVPTRKKLRTA